MRQLEPILKHHFWILLPLALIMSFTGWWISTGQMQAATTKRKAEIDGAEKRIPKDKVASADYEAKLKIINAKQKTLVDQSRDLLYAQQKKKMVWPEGDIRKHAAKLKYLGEFDNISPLLFRSTGYAREVKRVYEIPRPINPLDGSGVVEFSKQTMPAIDWGQHKPTSTEMWYAMEDLWLLEPILQAVLAVNGGPEATRYDAAVIAINELRLLGGNRAMIGQAASSSTNSGGFQGGSSLSMGKKDREDYDSVAPVNRNTAGTAPGLDINPVDDLGDPSTGSADQGNDNSFLDPVPQQKQSLLGTGRRYIDDDPSLPYRTRGFKLTVTMDHRRLPDFYAELTNTEGSPWPIQILRMHIAAAGDSQSASSRASVGAGESSLAFGQGDSRRGGGNLGFRKPGPTGATNPGGNLPSPATTSNAPTNETAYLAKVTLIGLITLYNEPDTVTSPTESAAAGIGAASADSPATPADSSGEMEADGEGEMTTAEESPAMTEPGDGATAEEEGEMTPGATPPTGVDDPDSPQPPSSSDDGTPTEEAETEATATPSAKPDQ